MFAQLNLFKLNSLDDMKYGYQKLESNEKQWSIKSKSFYLTLALTVISVLAPAAFIYNIPKYTIFQSDRLPDNVIPIQYELNLFTNLKTFEYGGLVTVLVNITRETDSIVVHGDGLIIHHFSLSKEGVLTDGLEVTNIGLQMLRLSFPMKFNPGSVSGINEHLLSVSLEHELHWDFDERTPWILSQFLCCAK
jgi:hypothetical protein